MNRVPTTAEDADATAEGSRRATSLPPQPAPAHDTAVHPGHDWQAFRAEHFPDSRRHDLEALTAYAAYMSSRAVGEQSSTEPRRVT